MKLNETTAKILCGLTRYPQLNVKELSKKIGLTQWSIYKGIEKMKDIGLFREVYIPNFSSLGFELLVAGYGSLTKKKMYTIENLRKIGRKNFSSSIFYAFAESYKGFVFALAKSYTDFSRSLIYAEKYVGVRDLLRSENVNIVFLPLSLTRMPIFFDYSGILCRDFGVHFPKKSERVKRMNVKGIYLSVMKKILENPDITSTQIAKNFGISIQRASKIRRELVENGMLVKRIIPNMRLLDYEVLVFAHWQSNPGEMEAIEKIDFNMEEYDLSPLVFLAYTSLEGVAVALFKNLQESREIISLFENLGERVGVLSGEPNILFLSLQEGVKIKEHDYYPLVEDAFRDRSSKAMLTSKATP